MPVAPRILALAGSARAASYNVRLLRLAAESARAAGAEVTLVEMREYPLPIMDEDYESAEGIPENARKLKALMKSHHGFLIACPEYNSSITPMLKNVIDWASRREDGEKPLECFTGKTVGLISASPGALGGLRGLVHVRSILGNINALVIGEQFALSKAHEAFTVEGALKDAGQAGFLASVVKRLVEVTGRLA